MLLRCLTKDWIRVRRGGSRFCALHGEAGYVSLDAAAWPKNDWWTAYADPQLNELISEALTGNPGLRVAEARTRAALAQVAASDSALPASVPPIPPTSQSSRWMRAEIRCATSSEHP